MEKDWQARPPRLFVFPVSKTFKKGSASSQAEHYLPMEEAVFVPDQDALGEFGISGDQQSRIAHARRKGECEFTDVRFAGAERRRQNGAAALMRGIDVPRRIHQFDQARARRERGVPPP